jgi:predicted transcriptional regulator
MKLTTGQTEVMNAILEEPRSINGISWEIGRSSDSVRSILRRLEDRFFVRRFPVGSTTHWEMTATGRRAIK